MRESLCGSRIETHGAKELLDPATCLTGVLSDAVELQWLAQNLRDTPPAWNGKPVPVDFSFGVCELRAGASPDHSIAEADQAMYEQKRSGPKQPKP